MAAGDVTYCDDYEEITGKKIPETDAEPSPVVETKVVEAPEPAPVAPATTAQVE